MTTQMLYLPQTKAAIERSLLTAKPIVDGDRKDRAAKALGYDRSVSYQEQDLTASYAQLYDAESAVEWLRQPKACYNIARRVGDELCNLYSDPVKREWEKTEAVWDAAFADFAPWWNRKMGTIDRRTFFGGCCFARPYVLEPGGPVRIAVYGADQIDVTMSPDDPEQIWQVVLTWTLGQGASTAVHRLFMTDGKMLWTVNDDIVPDPDYPNGDHPYGRIPGVLFTNDDADGALLGEPADDLVIANRTLNRGVTCLNETVDFQGQSLMVTVMGDDTKRIKVGPRRRVNFNDPQGNLFFASPNAPIEATISSANFNLSLMCRARGISEDAFLLSRQGESGVAIVARRASLVDWRRRRANTMRDREAELAQLSLLMREIHTMRRSWRGTELPPAPMITYTIPQEALSADIRADIAEKIRVNAATPSDYLLAENPALDRETADKMVQDFAAFNRDLAERGVPGYTEGADDEDEDEEAADADVEDSDEDEEEDDGTA